MSRKQKTVIITAAVIITFMGIYPPWLRTVNSQYGEIRESYVTPLGYAFIFHPPTYRSASVDLTRLSIQFFVVIAVTISLLLVLKEHPGKST